jgi:hypothetical protein
VVTKFENPFILTQMNVPDGVNLMANTPAYGLTIPLVPVTLLFGAQASFALMTVIALAGTAVSWYWFLSRYVVESRVAALVGGMVCGFGPGMLAQALAYPNIASQFVIPLILAQVLELRKGQRTLRHGVILGLLATYQAFINEEILFLTALACAVFFGFWALTRRREAAAVLRPVLAGFGIAAGVAGALLAYPLYMQFLGPQAYHGMWDGAQWFGADIYSFVSFSSETIGGSPANVRFAQDAAEQNSYFGWPLLATCALVIVVLWRRLLVRATLLTGIIAFLMSLGPVLIYKAAPTNISGPYALLSHLPLFDSVIATRWALVLLPLVAILLALWLDTTLGVARAAPRDRSRLMSVLALGLVAVSLVPLFPRRIHITSPEPIPGFFSSGQWRSYVPTGRTIVPVPLASNIYGEEPIRWAEETNLEFTMPGGYFLGPDPSTPDRRSMFGAPYRPTSALFIKVVRAGRVPVITEADRRNAVDDLKFWRAAIVVLPQRTREEALWKLTTDLLGFPPTWKNGIWVWDVRQIAA